MTKVIRSTLEEYTEEMPHKVKGWKMFLHVVLFLFLFATDVADFVSDWLFFADVKSAEKGLVYGVPEPTAVWFLLVFSIIGTFTFIFECINLWWEFFRNNPWMDSDYLSAIVIWIEDVPQIIISMYLVLCREEPISVFQLSKAAVVLIGVVIRIVVTSVKYCNKKAVRSHHHVKIKVVIMLGVIIEAMCAIVIFFLTQTERANSGEISFRIPSTVVEETYNDQRYFSDVSLFLHNDELPDVGVPDLKKAGWLRLDSIYGIREADLISYKIEYGQSGGSNTNLAISRSPRNDGNWTLSECYTINRNTATIMSVSNSTCSQAAFFTNSTRIFLIFFYEDPGSIFKRKIFGDIQMNIKKLQNGVCTSITQYADSIESSSNSTKLTFHYYRTNQTLQQEDIKHLLYQSGTPRFFRESDLIDVSKVWKTGWRECDSQGYVAPNLDSNLAITCS